MKRLVFMFVFVSMCIASYSFACDQMDFSLTLSNVEFRPGVTSDIYLKVFVNEKRPILGRTVFAIAGFAHTAETWKPFAEAVFEKDDRLFPVSKIVAIDFPGQGGSSIPEGMIFGEMVLADYVQVCIKSLSRLNDMYIRPRTIIGHSQGGLIVQMIQQQLINSGSSLSEEFNINKALLLASAPPKDLPWYALESGMVAQLIGNYVTSDAVLGPIVFFPATDWPYIFFSNLSGIPASGTPTPQEVEENGYNCPEPLYVALNLSGTQPFERPVVDAGIFKIENGTLLRVATYEQDILIRPEENQALYIHLTGDQDPSGVTVVNGGETVHDLHLADPEFLIDCISAD